MAFRYLESNSYEKITKPGLERLTIYPFPSDYVAGLVTELIQVHYRLNTAEVIKAFHNAGFEAECLIGKWRKEGGLPPKKLCGPYFDTVGKVVRDTFLEESAAK